MPQGLPSRFADSALDDDEFLVRSVARVSIIEVSTICAVRLAVAILLCHTTLVWAQNASLTSGPNGAAKQAQDWADLARYRSADEALPPPKASEKRVVFLGDSITEGWGEVPGSTFFPGKPYINRGISGQTTPQMLVRFRPDVVALQPAVVVILGGTNDLAGNTGPMTLADTENNLMSMVDIARENAIRVVLASVTPASAFPWRPGIQPAEKIRVLNSWIKGYAEKKHLVYLDYYSAMVNGEGGMKEDLTKDGVHPNVRGYSIMAPLAERAITEALQ